MPTEIPRISLDDRRAGEVTYEAFKDIGFVLVKVSEEIEDLRSRLAESTRRIFALPRRVKQQYNGEKVKYQRGWIPEFTELALACRHHGPGKRPIPNAYEAWFMGRDLSANHRMRKFSPSMNAVNIWPYEIPEFQQDMTAMYDMLYPIGMKVLHLLAPHIDLTPAYFDEITRDGTTVMRALHYPPLTADALTKVKGRQMVWGCRHTDINLITILLGGTKPGLYIKLKGKNVWIPAIAPQGYVFVQVGDMLQHLTLGKLTSAWHEVRAPDEITREGRLSWADFIHPRSDVILGAEGHKRFPPRTADSLLQERLDAIGLGGKGAKKKKMTIAY